MKYVIYSSEKLLCSGDAISVTLPCTDGELCIMDNHLPLSASLKKGTVRIKSENETKTFIIGSGAAYVKNNELSVYTDDTEINS